MKEADSDRGGESIAAGLDGLEGSCALENVLRGLEQPVSGDLCGEPAGAGKSFDDAVCPL